MKKIWIVSHYEIWQVEPDVFLDGIVEYVASTLEKAEAFIKDVHIFGDAWWQIMEFNVDKETGTVHYYGNKGRPLKTSPYKRAIKIFRKEYAFLARMSKVNGVKVSKLDIEGKKFANFGKF